MRSTLMHTIGMVPGGAKIELKNLAYGGMARHGGGAFSGKNGTKVDRSGAYAARQIARDVVARGWADVCEVRKAAPHPALRTIPLCRVWSSRLMMPSFSYTQKTMLMIVWDEPKRQTNLAKPGLCRSG